LQFDRSDVQRTQIFCRYPVSKEENIIKNIKKAARIARR
jgi:hypothetical protein